MGADTAILTLDITPAAQVKIKELLEKNNQPAGYGVRVGLKGGGCSGLSYHVDFEHAKRPGDRVYDVDGIPVFVDLKSALYLKGATMDYKENVTSSGFTFENPNATRSCSCGSSFSI